MKKKQSACEAKHPEWYAPHVHLVRGVMKTRTTPCISLGRLVTVDGVTGIALLDSCTDEILILTRQTSEELQKRNIDWSNIEDYRENASTLRRLREDTHILRTWASKHRRIKNPYGESIWKSVHYAGLAYLNAWINRID